MRRLALALALVGLVACGDDDTPVLDGSIDAEDGGEACVVVDGRGGADRFATIDDALASGATRLCLTAGDFAPPSEAIEGTLEISGVLGETRVDGSFGCVDVSLPAVLDEPARGASAAVIALRGDARVVLRELEVRGCDVGVFVEGGELLAERITTSGVDLGVLGVGPTASMTLREMRAVARNLQPTDRVPFAGGLGALEGARLTIEGARVEGANATLGLVAYDGPLDVTDLEIVGGLGGFLVRGAEASPARMANVRVSELRAVRVVDEAIAANVVLGGSVRIESIELRGIEGHGLVAREGASLEVDGVLAEDVRDIAFLARAGTRVTLDTSVVRRSAVGAGSEAGGELTFATSATMEQVDVGIAVYGGGLVNVPATTALVLTSSSSDVATGAFVDEGGTLDLRGGELSGFVLGVLNSGRATLADVSITDCGVGMASAGTTIATDVLVDGAGAIGVYSTPEGTVDLTRTRVSRARVGAWLRGGAHRFADVQVLQSLGVGVLLDEAAALVAQGGAIRESASRGVEARAGASLELRGAELRANVDAAIAIYDASAQVSGCTFGGTLPDASGRADELRAVAREGEVSVVVESSQFDLDVTRDCAVGRCTLVLGEGAGVAGIVRPNCLVEGAATAAVRTVVDQDGATFTLEGDPTWSTLLAGRASDLGLVTGVLSTRPPIPEAPTIPAPTDEL